MTEQKFKYDVAFSFLKEDEALAVEICDLVQERLSTFLYSRKQEAVAGTDGEVTFGNVFGKEARFVVVLYRANWGNTPWTRIEQDAIRNRAFDEGYGFTIFMPLDNPPTVPRWLPRTQIWVSIDRFGVKGATSVIEMRVQELGGEVRKESIEDRAVRIKRKIENDERRKAYLNSDRAVKSATEEVEILLSRIEGIVAKLSGEVGLDLRSQRGAWGGLDAWGRGGYCVSVDWVGRFANTTDKSHLTVRLLLGLPDRPRRLIFEEPKLLRTYEYRFDVDASLLPRWQLVAKEPPVSTDQLADHCVAMLLDQIQRGQ
jgi:hypothetical protein